MLHVSHIDFWADGRLAATGYAHNLSQTFILHMYCSYYLNISCVPFAALKVYHYSAHLNYKFFFSATIRNTLMITVSGSK